MAENLVRSRAKLCGEIDRRVADGILEKSNAVLLKKLIEGADSLSEAIAVAELGTTYRRTGLHFDKRLEKLGDTIRYLRRSDALSFSGEGAVHRLIIGENYHALLNLLIEYRGRVDVIYIDPPYGKDSMGEFAKTNYENALTRDNLLSMLYPRLMLARELLSPETGVIFCSIDDRNQAYVKCLMDEIFGESRFLFNVPRITKKGGKSTQTIAKNNDYILAYTLSDDIIFGQEEKSVEKYRYEDEHAASRGPYALTQTLDYDSLQYSEKMDYEIVAPDGRRFWPGGDREAHERRRRGEHGVTDWVWRWSRSAVEWGFRNDMFVIRRGRDGRDRIYTKSYLRCRKKNGQNELEFIDPAKAYTTLSFLDNAYSNDNGKKELDRIFDNGSALFKNPKPTKLIAALIRMVCPDRDAVILDFFAGSGTTGQAVLQLNAKDGGRRRFLLCTNNEITDTTPGGIAADVTCRRLKRVMTGCCYDGSRDFERARRGEAPLGGALEVCEIAEVPNNEAAEGRSPFDVIDETLYGRQRFASVREKVEWVCANFEMTQRDLADPEPRAGRR